MIHVMLLIWLCTDVCHFKAAQRYPNLLAPVIAAIAAAGHLKIEDALSVTHGKAAVDTSCEGTN